MLRIVICDDNASQLEFIRNAVQEYMSRHQELKAEIKAFDNSYCFLKA